MGYIKQFLKTETAPDDFQWDEDTLSLLKDNTEHGDVRSKVIFTLDQIFWRENHPDLVIIQVTGFILLSGICKEITFRL